MAPLFTLEPAPTPQNVWETWSVNPWFALALALALIGYGLAFRRMRVEARHATPWWRAIIFLAGWTVLALSLLSPLETATRALATAHMVQYLLLSTVAPPLLLLGAPGRFSLAPTRTPGTLPVWERQVGAAWSWLTRPVVVSAVDLGLLVGWHLSGPYQAALTNPILHILQPATFLFGGFLFWWIVLYPNAPGRSRQAGTLLAILVTSLLSTGFAMSLFFSGTNWYPIYEQTTGPWGLSLKDDQQMAAVTVVAPADTTDMLSFLWVFAAWMRKLEVDQRQRERTAAAARGGPRHP